MNNKIIDDFIEGMKNDELDSNGQERDYNFRRMVKKREQKRRKEIYDNAGYFPTMPNKGIGENGKEYYIEGRKDEVKKCLKRIASKKTRKAKHLKKGNHYKKVYNLVWTWY